MDKIKKLPLRDFTRYCMSIAAVPSSYLAGLSFEEQMLWLCSFLTDEVIPAVNNNGGAVEELQTLYVELKNYVDNYFDNLDIQEEVNTKLEEMAQSGELAELISQYLEAQAVIGFNTNASLATATNLANGSFAKTMGRTTYNDGQGAFYKIRTRTNADNPDGDNLIVLTNTENLVAEIIPYSRTYDIQSNLQEQIDDINNNLLTELVVVGDSYTALSASNWAEIVAQQLGLNLHKHGTSSMGFVHEVGGQTFVDNLSWGESSTIKNKTKYVICYGGINDVSENKTDLYNNVKTFCSTAKTMYPNARIIIVGPQAPATGISGMLDTINAIQKGASDSGVSYSNAYNWLVANQYKYTTTYDSDNVHPSELGYKIIASKMLDLISGNVIQNNLIKFTFHGSLTGDIKVSNNNNICSLRCTVTNAELPPRNFVSVLDCNIPFKDLIPGDQYFPVYHISTNYYYADDFVGFASFNGDYSQIRIVNITGSTISGKIGFRADIMTSATN